MLDFLAISLGAIVGANLRYWMSRYAVRVLGPIFPYGTPRHQRAGQLCAGLLPGVDDGAGDGRSALAPADRGRLLRRVHDIFQLRLRDHGLLRAGPMDVDGGKFRG
jgi:hypothetical protein